MVQVTAQSRETAQTLKTHTVELPIIEHDNMVLRQGVANGTFTDDSGTEHEYDVGMNMGNGDVNVYVHGERSYAVPLRSIVEAAIELFKASQK